MLDLMSLDLEEVAMALADQTDYAHRWLINPRTGEVVSGPATQASMGQRLPSCQWIRADGGERT